MKQRAIWLVVGAVALVAACTPTPAEDPAVGSPAISGVATTPGTGEPGFPLSAFDIQDDWTADTVTYEQVLEVMEQANRAGAVSDTDLSNFVANGDAVMETLRELLRAPEAFGINMAEERAFEDRFFHYMIEEGMSHQDAYNAATRDVEELELGR